VVSNFNHIGVLQEYPKKIRILQSWVLQCLRASCFEFQMPLIIFGPLRMCTRMFLATIILEVNTLEQQDIIYYHQNICNIIGLTP